MSFNQLLAENLSLIIALFLFIMQANSCINKPLSSSFNTSEEAENTKAAIREIWEVCKELIYNNSLDKLILDEIGLAIEWGFIKEKELINVLENRHESIDVIFTGPSIPSKVFAMADQITQLRCSK